MRWNPSKEEIQYWVVAKEHEFSVRETQGLRVSVEQWKDMYIYSDMHELFFVEFLCLVHEWLKRQVAINSVVLSLEPIVWNQATIKRLKVLDNK
jgi:hypothetical protein